MNNKNNAYFFVYETVDIPLLFEPTGSLEGYDKIIVSLAQFGETILEKTNDALGIDVENDRVNLSLSQEETAMFIGGKKCDPKIVDIQVNIYYTNRERNTTFNEVIEVYDNQHKEVMSNE